MTKGRVEGTSLLLQHCFPKFCYFCKKSFIIFLAQPGASSHAKNGGAYFSAVTGSIQDPIAVPGPCEVTEFSELRNVRDMGNGRYM